MTRNDVYPLGMFGLVLLDTLFKQWVVYANAPPGSPERAAALGGLLLVGFLLQAAISPWLGQWADGVRHRWGRRRPFVLLVGPVLAAAFGAGFLGVLPAWLAVPAYGALFVTVTQPYLSLLPEVAPEPRTRLRYSVAGAGLALLATGVALLAGPRLVAEVGFAGLVGLGVVGFAATVWAPALVLREPPPPERSPPLGVAGFAAAARQPRVARFLVGNGLLFAGFLVLLVLAPYLPQAVLGQELAYTKTLNGWLFAGMLVGVAGVAAGKRFAPVVLLRVGAGVGAVTVVLLALLARRPAAEASLPLWLAGMVALGVVGLLTMALPPLIVAELADADGQRREGLFFGLNGAALNLASALAAGGCAALLGLGATAARPDGVRAVLVEVAALLIAATLALPGPAEGAGAGEAA